jgi:hypothetical protein
VSFAWRQRRSGRGLELLKLLAKTRRLNLQGCRGLRDDAAAVPAGFQQFRALDLKDSSPGRRASGEFGRRCRDAR